MSSKDLDPKVIVALDYPDVRQALRFVQKVTPRDCALKVGKELFTASGPKFVEKLAGKGFRVFLDMKFHDIPNTVAAALLQAADLGVWMVNVHCLGGPKMLAAASTAMAKLTKRPLLIGVTILTSIDDGQLRCIGIESSMEEEVLLLARLARDAGLDGVVSSAHEAAAIKQATDESFITVTPGIRLIESSSDDQSRVMTPFQAIENQADYLVMGRPITKSPDPVATLAAVNQEVREALGG